MKKFVAILMAILMLTCVMPIAVFADDDTSDNEALVVAWEDNYSLLIELLTDNSVYASWQYVVDNNDDIATMMDVYTAFGLYDSAWVNFATDNVDTEICEEVLLSMIEQYDYEAETEYLEAFVEALEVVDDVTSFIETLNEYFSIFDFVDSDTWSSLTGVVGTLIEVGYALEDIKNSLIATYEQIMTVQLANAYYIDMLEYIAENVEYDTMATAAENLIDEIEQSVEDLIATYLEDILSSESGTILNLLASLALNSNAYTAVALTVYNTASSIADVLWNTSDQYELYAALIASFYAQTTINDYTVEALEDDADKAVFAVSALIATRAYGEQTLYALIEAQSGGIIGAIKSALYAYSCTTYSANVAALDLMYELMYETDVDDMVEIVTASYVYCPVNVLVYKNGVLVLRVKDGAESSTGATTYGAGIAEYCEYNDEYVKVLFLAADYDITLVGTDDGYVTYIKYYDGLEDYSFTEAEIAEGDKIVISGTTYTVDDTTYDLNDEFEMPEGKEVTASDVVDAVVTVASDTASSIAEKIKAFFQSIIDWIKSLFGID